MGLHKIGGIKLGWLILDLEHVFQGFDLAVSKF